MSSTAPYIAAWGIVSPLGHSRPEFTDSLREGISAVRDTDGIPAATVEGFPPREGFDRTLQFLDSCADQLHPALDACLEIVPPERRAVAAATSKGALLQYLREPTLAARSFMDLSPCKPLWHLARRYQCAGPAGSFSAACATGLSNVLRAAEYIQDGLADLAIAGSSEATIHPFYLSSFQNLGVLATDRSVPFDACHNGFVPGEGAALFLLVSERVALQAGLKPLARIAGYAFGADAFHSVGIDTSGAMIAHVGNLAVQRADWDLSQVDLLVAHATATRSNDEAEAAAIHTLLGKNRCDTPVYAHKAASGHLMGAAGAVELAASLAAMEGGFLPATSGFSVPAPRCEKLRILTKSRSAPVRRVLKWSFGFGGQLVAAALESVNNTARGDV